jgi:hypothetical protein
MELSQPTPEVSLNAVADESMGPWSQTNAERPEGICST